MAVPKRKMSHSRTRTRCAHDSLTPANTQNCPNCGEATLPHRMCNHCGHYRGRAIKEVAET